MVLLWLFLKALKLNYCKWFCSDHLLRCYSYCQLSIKQLERLSFDSSASGHTAWASLRPLRAPVSLWRLMPPAPRVCQSCRSHHKHNIALTVTARFQITKVVTELCIIMHYYLFSFISVPVWLSGRALRQQRKRLWVRFPENTHTNENV